MWTFYRNNILRFWVVCMLDFPVVFDMSKVSVIVWRYHYLTNKLTENDEIRQCMNKDLYKSENLQEVSSLSTAQRTGHVPSSHNPACMRSSCVFEAHKHS